MIFPILVLFKPFEEFLNKQQDYLFKRTKQCYQQIDFVFQNNLIFNLQFLKQYTNRYQLFKFIYFPKRKRKTADRLALCRPGRAAGRVGSRSHRPLAGPGWACRPGWCPNGPALCRPRPGCPGRAPYRALRPSAGPAGSEAGALGRGRGGGRR